MKRIFIIVLVVIMVLGVFNIAVAQEKVDIDLEVEIQKELGEIEKYLLEDNIEEANIHLTKLREYVYQLTLKLIDENKYTDKVFDIIRFASKAIKENNIEYLTEAKETMVETLSSKSPIVEKTTHS